MMKKLLSAVLAVMMIATLTACGAKTESVKNLEGTSTEIIEKVYEQHKPEFYFETAEVDLNDADSFKTFTGLDSADKISEVSVSEPMMSSQAYSLVMVRVKDAKDSKEVAEAMKAGINPRKWVCVEADDIAAAGYGDMVMFVMVSSELDSAASKDMIQAFKTVCGGTLSFEL